jgi:hypothetical protein
MPNADGTAASSICHDRARQGRDGVAADPLQLPGAWKGHRYSSSTAGDEAVCIDLACAISNFDAVLR